MSTELQLWGPHTLTCQRLLGGALAPQRPSVSGAAGRQESRARAFVSDRLSNVEGSSNLQHLDLTNACATLKVVSKDGRNEGGSCLTFKNYHKGKNLPSFFPPLCL